MRMERNARINLKPCPFCGSNNIRTGQALVAIGPYNNVITCDDCGMYCKPPATEWNEAIGMWNRRIENQRTEMNRNVAGHADTTGHDGKMIVCADIVARMKKAKPTGWKQPMKTAARNGR